MALYRKYRPATFAEVVGQRHVTDPLSAALESRGADGTPDRINHAYLFSGPRGCGKTSSARILARSLNCAEGPTATPCGKCASCVALAPGGPGNLDVMELDAASHNKVEDMRDLRDKAMYAPADSRYRVIIIDEAHMVTRQGFNALLKIVEEPPEHLIFIFATTEPEAVLPTIRSRTHHYPFRLLPPNLMKGLLQRIVAEENVPVADDVYPLVIAAGGGSPRDSLSLMDQLLAGAGPEGVTHELAAGLLGVTDQGLLDDAIGSLTQGDRAALFRNVDAVVKSGQDPKRFAEDLLGRVRDLLVIAAVPNALEEGLVDAPVERFEVMREQAAAVPTGTLTRFADVLQRGLPDMRGATSPRLLLEVLAARMLLPASEQSLESVIQRLDALERGVVAGGGAGAGASGGAGGGQQPQPGQQAGAQQAQSGGQQPQPGQQAGAQQAQSGGQQVPSGQQPGAQQVQNTQPPAGDFADDANLSPLQRARMRMRGRTAGAAPEQQTPPAQPQAQPQTQHQASPVRQEAAPAQPTPAQSAPDQRDRQHDAPAEPQAQQSAEPQTRQSTEPQIPAASPQAQPGQQPDQQPGQQPGVPEVPDQEEQARKAREMREISRRMQEQAREHERAERARMAREREAAARAAEGMDRAAEAQTGQTGRQQPDHQPEQRPEPQQQRQPEQRHQPEQPQPEQQHQPEQRQPEQQRRQEPEPQATANADDDHLASLRDGWSRVVDFAGEDNIPVRVMAAQAVPVALEDGVLTIGHHTGALANRLNDPANAAALGAAVQRVEGIDVEVRCVVGTQPRGRAARSGARPRQHQAPSSDGPEEASSTNDGESPTGDSVNEGTSPAGMNGGHSLSDATPTAVDMSPAEAGRHVEAREREQERAREEARERAQQPPSRESESRNDGRPERPVPAYRRILEERRRAKEAAERAAGQAGHGDSDHGASGQVADAGRKKYVPPPPARGTQGVRRPRHDDIPLPPEPFDDAPPPPEPDYGPYPDDAGAAGYGGPAGAPRQAPAGGSAPGQGTGPVGDDGLNDEERELLDAARTPGQLDHRDQKEVVMELLAKELGARPL